MSKMGKHNQKLERSLPPADEKQKKISSFFTTGGQSTEKQNQLFSAVGQASKSKTKLSLQKKKSQPVHPKNVAKSEEDVVIIDDSPKPLKKQYKTNQRQTVSEKERKNSTLDFNSKDSFGLLAPNAKKNVVDLEKQNGAQDQKLKGNRHIQNPSKHVSKSVSSDHKSVFVEKGAKTLVNDGISSGMTLGGSGLCVSEENDPEHMRFMRLKYFNKKCTADEGINPPLASDNSQNTEVLCVPETQECFASPSGATDFPGVIASKGKFPAAAKLNMSPEDVEKINSSKSPEDTSVSTHEKLIDISMTGDDSDIIPDTPDIKTSSHGSKNTSGNASKAYDSILGRRTKKVLHRTFLTSASSFTPPFPQGGVRKPKPKLKSQKGRSLEEALKETNVENLEKWNPGSVGYYTLTNEAGLGQNEPAKSTDGGQDRQIGSEKGVNKGFGVKRLSTTSTGESPDSKRLNRKSSGQHSKVSCDMFTARTSETKKKNEIENCKIRLKFDPDVQKSSKLKGNPNIKNPNNSRLEGNISGKFPGTQGSRMNQPSPAVKEDTENDALGDILNELKQELSQKYSPHVALKKKCKPRIPTALSHSSSHIGKSDCLDHGNQNGESSNSPLDTVLKAGIGVSDDALCDILNELKENASIPKRTHKKSPASRSCGSSGTRIVDLSPTNSEAISEGGKPNLCDMNESKSLLKEEMVGVQSDGAYFNSGNLLNVAAERMECEDSDSEVRPDHAVTGSEAAFEDDIDGNLEEELAANLQKLSPFKASHDCSVTYDPTTALPPAKDFGRFTVMEVNKSSDAVKLIVEKEFGHKKQTKCVTLEGFWTDTHVSPGDKIHIIGDEEEHNELSVTDKGNLLIVNPDLLISGTSVVSSVHCMRRSVLNEKFKGYDSKNIYMLHGSIIHSFFQQVVQQRAFSTEAMNLIAERVLMENKFLHEMYGQAVTEASVMEEIKKYMQQVLDWTEKYVPPKVYTLGQKKGIADLSITGVKDIEENVWSPRYGVKGKIDLTVEVKIHKDGKHKLMPLELKTGRPTYSIEHKGQVTLYAMMSGDRREDPGSGLLLYLKDGSMKPIPADYQNKRGLIQLRNELSHHLKQSLIKGDNDLLGSLPPTINQRRTCAKCPQLLNCCAFQRSVENNPAPDGHAMSELVPEAIGHLDPHHLQYYARWIRLMHLELAASGPRSNMSDLWCKTAWEREQRGQCYSGMLLKRECCSASQADSNQYIQAFCRIYQHPSKISLTSVGLTKGDSVVVSAENKTLIALSSGFIHAVTQTQVSLLLDRDLRCYPDYESTVFRLDKCDNYNIMGSNFTNLARLMDNNNLSGRLREIVIDKRCPQFQLTMSKGTIAKVTTIFKSLNKPQKTAILKVLMAKDYVLIKGYPGTGKTSTIVALVRILVALGNSVLLSSYTHSAVDNILLKLKKYHVDFTRMGRIGKIHAEIQPFAAEILTKPFTRVDELRQFYDSKAVIATTCLGTSHALFSQRKFDVCIVDEASQVLQPACFGTLFCSHKFVLVGDPKQLPPVVQSKEAREAGMAESLFARLDDTGGTYELNLQYRMNAEIMRLSNELVYNGALKCGSEQIANSCLQISADSQVLQQYPSWLQSALNSQSGHQVAFLDTEQVSHQESDTAESKVSNVMEAAVISQLTQTAVQIGVSECDIGVIAVYSQQVKVLKERLRKHGLHEVEVNTVDQYQGRDKPLIIVSFVKTAVKDGHTSEILKDVRRLNVALTRAKHKLLLVGCAKTLQKYEPLQRLIKTLKSHQMVVLPADVELEC